MKKLFFLLLSLIMIGQSAFSLTVNTTAGGLATAVGAELSTVTNLTITGTIDARDFKTMRDNMPLLAVINISGTSIEAYSTSSKNQIPVNSFYYTSTYTGKTALKTIILPTTLTSIGEDAFHGCSGITSINLPNSITSIGSAAFGSCTGITGGLALPTALSSLGNYAFSNCPAITGSIIFPAALSSIGTGAFQYSVGISSLVFPNVITSVGAGAFQYCVGLKTIFCLNSTPPTLGSSCFNGITSITDVYVPTDAAVTAYKANAGWISYFPGDIIKLGAPSALPTLSNSSVKVYTTKSSIVVEGALAGETVSIYNIMGMKLQTVQSQGERLELPIKNKGIYLVKIAKETVKVNL